MRIVAITTIFAQLISLAVLAAFIYLLILLVRALRKYLKSSEVRKEKASVQKSLGETLKEHRTRCRMSQEYVAESLGVSPEELLEKPMQW